MSSIQDLVSQNVVHIDYTCDFQKENILVAGRTQRVSGYHKATVKFQDIFLVFDQAKQGAYL